MKSIIQNKKYPKQKQVKFFFNYITIFCIAFISCTNEHEQILPNEQLGKIAKELFEQNEYNMDLQDFALAVSNAMNKSTEFRELIKQEALVKFDGDYDVLLTRVANKSVKPVKDLGLRSNINYSVKDLLEDCYISNSVALRASVGSIIDDLLVKYPNLQVSVPVHAEDWDAASLIPIVAFVPLEYEDGVTQSVAGYESDGNRIAVDAINPPDKVVIVVGQNERMARIRQDDAITPFDDFTYPPSAPTNLKATTTAEAVQLSWTKPSSLNGTIGYYVYRKSSSNAAFKMYSTLNGVDNVVYYDQTAEAGKTYFYYVVAYSDYFLESAPSSTVSAVGARPAVLSSFEVNALTDTQVELRWVTESADYQKVQLYRQVVGNNSDYQLHQEFGANVYDYFDNNMHLLAGKKIQYRIQTVTSAGSISIPKYDFLYMSYRNPSYNSPIRIKRIQCSENVEGWLMGTPEILIKVYGVDSERKTTEVASIWFDMNSYNQSFNQFVLNWKPDNWYQRYTFHAIEEDPGKDIKISIAANIGVKKTEGVMTVGAEAGISKEFNFSQPEDIGTADLSFYDPINTTLFFHKGKYWCYLTLGE